MSRRARLSLFAVSLAALGFLLVLALLGLPDFGNYKGPYGIVIQHIAVPLRHATDIVNAVTYDFRGIDTMGEEFILFASAIGLVVLLREQRDEQSDEDEEERQERDPRDSRHQETSAALRALGLGLIGPTLVLGVYIITHGQLTPGGGFQGGVIMATGLILVYLIGRYLTMARVRPIPLVELCESAGAAGFAAVGVGGLIAGAQFLLNFLPLGTVNQLLSGGTIALLSVAVGFEVTGAFTLILSEFFDQRLLHGGGR